jgi:hypothetical protein
MGDGDMWLLLGQAVSINAMEPGLFLEVSIKIFYLLSDCQFILKNK